MAVPGSRLRHCGTDTCFEREGAPLAPSCSPPMDVAEHRQASPTSDHLLAQPVSSGRPDAATGLVSSGSGLRTLAQAPSEAPRQPFTPAPSPESPTADRQSSVAAEAKSIETHEPHPGSPRFSLTSDETSGEGFFQRLCASFGKLFCPFRKVTHVKSLHCEQDLVKSFKHERLELDGVDAELDLENCIKYLQRVDDHPSVENCIKYLEGFNVEKYPMKCISPQSITRGLAPWTDADPNLREIVVSEPEAQFEEDTFVNTQATVTPPPSPLATPVKEDSEPIECITRTAEQEFSPASRKSLSPASRKSSSPASQPSRPISVDDTSTDTDVSGSAPAGDSILVSEESTSAKDTVAEPAVEQEAVGVTELERTVDLIMWRLREVTPPEQRHKVFNEQCRAWHPDKNSSDLRRATVAFQALQSTRTWFLAKDEDLFSEHTA